MTDKPLYTIVSYCNDNIVSFEREFIIPYERLKDWLKWLESEKWDFPDYAIEVSGRVVFSEYQTL